MEIDEIYKEWCGISRLENSVKLVHDSTEAIEFAEYYHKSLKNNADIAVAISYLLDKCNAEVMRIGYWDGEVFAFKSNGDNQQDEEEIKLNSL